MRFSPHLSIRKYSTKDRCNEAIFAYQEYIGDPLGIYNGLYEMNTCSYGSFIKVVTFMRAFCNLIVKSREKCTKSRAAHSSEALFTV